MHAKIYVFLFLLSICLIFIRLIFGSTNYVSADIFTIQNFLSLATLLIGLGFMFLGVREFKKLQTTVNPLNPEAATSLVTSGVFSVTRNPMYLGMIFILLATSIFSGAWLGLLLILIFMWYIPLFQIIPEERAMKEKFNDWEDYCSKVRRWL